MRATINPYFTRRESGSKIKSFDLMVRAGLISQMSSGIYSLLPNGQRVVKNLKELLTTELNEAGAVEINLPILQPSEIWEQSGRWDAYSSEMYKLKDRKGKSLCLGPTHEEAVTYLAKQIIKSQKDLPLILFQFGKKFRDELRPRHGLLRTKEFEMKDAYSFDSTLENSMKSYDKIRTAYLNFFNNINLEVAILNAETGEIGGSLSEEFVAPATNGEDEFFKNDKGEYSNIRKEGYESMKGIEIGHIFLLEDGYSKPADLTINIDNKITLLYMGCYGIGITRLIPAIIEQSSDNEGIIWPENIAPFHYALISADNKSESREYANKVYHHLCESGIKILYDDRNKSFGEKMKDADLLGLSKIIIGSNAAEKGIIELQDRKTKKKSIIDYQKINSKNI